MIAHETTPLDGFYPVIPAGGAGTRLWPLSRVGSPKFFHDLTGAGRTLIQATYDRLAPLAGDGIVFVTGQRHVEELGRQLPGLSSSDIVPEPSPRDSMAAIGLAAAILRERHGDVVLGSFAADHVITDLAAFHDTVRQAVAVAREGWVATIGIEASGPSTAYGYIELGEPLAVAGAPSAHAVKAFTEKPDQDTAAAYLATGRYRWNAGMFVTGVSTLLAHLHDQRPALHDSLCEIAAAWDTVERETVLAARWPKLEKIAIDYAIAEPVAAAGGLAVVSGGFGWDDVGDWQSVAGLLDADGAEARVLGSGEEVLARANAASLIVPAGGKQVCVLGAQDLVVVDTPDALLVVSRDRAQEVKGLVDALRDAGRTDLL